MTKYKVGSIVTGQVTGIEKYGVFVSIDEYYKGLIHISEISNNFVKSVDDFVKVGEQVKAKIIDIDEDNFQVKLSIKDLKFRKYNKERRKIVETGSGFKILEDNLKNWINVKKK